MTVYFLDAVGERMSNPIHPILKLQKVSFQGMRPSLSLETSTLLLYFFVSFIDSYKLQIVSSSITRNINQNIQKIN